MSPLSRGIIRIALGSVTLACTHGAGQKATPRSSPDIITRAEMERGEFAPLSDVVLALRGRWLRPHGPITVLGRQGEVQVMVDGLRMGGVDTLRLLTSDTVVMIAFVDPVAAAERWGGKYAQGTIVIATHAERRPRHSAATQVVVPLHSVSWVLL